MRRCRRDWVAKNATPIGVFGYRPRRIALLQLRPDAPLDLVCAIPTIVHEE
jgi:hypothetical protein